MPQPQDPTDHPTALREAHARAIRETTEVADTVAWTETVWGHRAAAGSRFAQFLLRAAYWTLRDRQWKEAEARTAARATYDRPRRRD